MAGDPTSAEILARALATVDDLHRAADTLQHQVATLLGQTPPPPGARWLSVDDYATLVGVTRPTVYKWLDAGLVESFKVGRVRRVLVIGNGAPAARPARNEGH